MIFPNPDMAVRPYQTYHGKGRPDKNFSTQNKYSLRYTVEVRTSHLFLLLDVMFMHSGLQGWDMNYYFEFDHTGITPWFPLLR